MADEEKKSFVPYEKTHRLRKLVLVFTIVGQGQDRSIVELNLENEAAIAFSCAGKGTAPSALYSVFGVGELKKDVIVSVMREDKWPSYRSGLEARFAVSKLAKGLAFCIPIDSVIGISIYKMLTNMRLFEKPVNTKPAKKEKKKRKEKGAEQ